MTSDCHKELLKLDSVKTDVYIYSNSTGQSSFGWLIFKLLIISH